MLIDRHFTTHSALLNYEDMLACKAYKGNETICDTLQAMDRKELIQLELDENKIAEKSTLENRIMFASGVCFGTFCVASSLGVCFLLSVGESLKCYIIELSGSACLGTTFGATSYISRDFDFREVG